MFIVDDSEDTRALVKRYIEFNERFEIIGEAGSGNETLEKLKQTKPDVVLMDINMPNGNGLETTEVISKKYPEIVVVIMSVQREAEYLKKAMLSGAREYIIKPFNLDVLNQTIISAYDKEKERVNPLDLTIKTKSIENKMISFYSSKGGVGKSIIASNYALFMSKIQSEKVILVDFDLLFGDIRLLLDIKSKVKAFSLVEETGEIDIEKISKHIFNYSDNLDVMLSPSSPEYAEMIKSKDVETILLELKKDYKHIIIDLSNDFNETTLMSLDASDHIYYVSTPDLLSIKNTKVGLEVLDSLSYKDDKVRIIINQHGIYKGLESRDIQKIISKDIYFSLPYDQRTVCDSVLTGEMIASETHRMKSKMYKSLEKFVNMYKEVI